MGSWVIYSQVNFLSCDDSSPALVLTLQTAGEALNFNPHLHGALADGFLLPDGSFKAFQALDLNALLTTFENSLLAALRNKDLIDDGTVQQILGQQFSGFSVWLGDTFYSSSQKE